MMSKLKTTPVLKRVAAVSLGLLAVAPLAWQSLAMAAEAAVVIPSPTLDEPASSATSETVVLAGGCFWGVQGVFQHVKGVNKAISGYAGGAASTAKYGMVGMGTTGHAESVQVTFDPRQITYGQILQVYFSVAHDPTQLNGQGPDRGTQYRSTIFPSNEEQQKVAASYVAQLDKSGVYARPIASTIEPGKTFYPAEAYHQDFLANNPTYGYIVANDLPKIENLRKVFPDRYKDYAPPVVVSVR